MATYGHGMWTTPSVDGWTYGTREMNGYAAEITCYGEQGPVSGWHHYSVTIVDYVTGTRWVTDGCAKYADIRAEAIRAMQGRKFQWPLKAYGYREMSY